MVQALASGELDVMFFGIGPALVARGRGQEITVVASNIVEQIALIAGAELAEYWNEDDPASLFAGFEAGEGRTARIATFPQGSVPDIVLLSGSPARVVEEYRVEADRPRHVDDPAFQATVKRLRGDLHAYQGQPVI